MFSRDAGGIRRLRRAAWAVLVFFTTSLSGPLLAAEPVHVPDLQAAQRAAAEARRRAQDLGRLVGRTAATVGGTAIHTTVTAGGRVARTTGQVGAGVGREFGGAAGEVMSDVREGRLRWVIGPAKEAIAVTPQLHTAVRNTQQAGKQAAAVRKEQALIKRYLPKGAQNYRPAVPTRSVVAGQFMSPFQPANIALTLGLTFAGGMVVAAQSDEVTWRDAAESVKDRSLWTAMVGSGIGYAVASLLAVALIPAGATLFPVVAPMIVGTVGAIIGWIMGEQLGRGASFSEAVDGLSMPTILGLSIGSSMGLLSGALLGLAVGGPLGAVVATVGAIAGTLLFRKLGMRWGEAIAERLFPGSVGEDGDETAGVGVAPSAAATPAEPDTYKKLVEALSAGDQAEATRLHAKYSGRAVP